MDLLRPNHTLDAHALPLDRGDAIAAGCELARFGEHAVGIWEHAPGISTDVEVDEIFVVLAGEATVRFDDGSPELLLKPGVVARLAAGSATTWHVTQTLRKIYVLA